jgi:hypothetical protein
MAADDSRYFTLAWSLGKAALLTGSYLQALPLVLKSCLLFTSPCLFRVVLDKEQGLPNLVTPIK